MTPGKRCIIIVGSGASAVHAAWPLVDAGIDVIMLDVGQPPGVYGDLIPEKSFPEIRRTDPNQHRYFLGDRFEGLGLGEMTVGAQLTPPRQYLTALTDSLTPVKTSSFLLMESLALGGLASGWGAGCFPYSDDELRGFHLTRAELDPHYSAVAARIGICGDRDDLEPYYGDTMPMQPPLKIDANARSILAAYREHAGTFRGRGFALGYPRLAVLSQPMGDRKACRYYDMDFWADLDRSVYRPVYTLNDLRTRPNFIYRNGFLVERFSEHAGGITVSAMNIESGAEEHISGSALILAAGTFGTTRIVLRSLDLYNTPVPVVSNPYTYIPMVNSGRLGKIDDEPRYGLTQLCAVLNAERDGEGILHAQLYSYRSLLNFKLIKEIPLPYRSAIPLVRMLLTGFCIVGIHHEDFPSNRKTCILERGKGNMRDTLVIDFHPDDATIRRQREREQVMVRRFRKLGCLKLKRVENGNGSSIHYGGCLPISPTTRDLTVSRECLLRGTHSVYIADGAAFPYLPAKGPTYTMMANADRVGSHVRDRMRHG